MVNTAFAGSWRQFGRPRAKRPLKSVILQDHIAEKILDDVKAFLKRREWYADRGEIILPERPFYTLTHSQAFRTEEDICSMDRLDQENPHSYKLLQAHSLMIFAS